MATQVFKAKDTIITLDGPAASGKSSTAKALAQHLGIAFVSSGLLYRAVAYLVLRDQLLPQNEVSILSHLEKHQIKLLPNPKGNNQIYLDNEDITSYLHTDAIDSCVSTIAKHPNIRNWINEKLCEIKGSFVIEGRDMGSTVFPKAKHKFYLTASPEVRAKRRLGEREADLAEVSKAILERDMKDTKQLKPAEDAIDVDTNNLELKQVVEEMLKHISK